MFLTVFDRWFFPLGVVLVLLGAFTDRVDFTYAGLGLFIALLVFQLFRRHSYQQWQKRLPHAVFAADGHEVSFPYLTRRWRYGRTYASDVMSPTQYLFFRAVTAADPSVYAQSPAEQIRYPRVPATLSLEGQRFDFEVWRDEDDGGCPLPGVCFTSVVYVGVFEYDLPECAWRGAVLFRKVNTPRLRRTRRKKRGEHSRIWQFWPELLQQPI